MLKYLEFVYVNIGGTCIYQWDLNGKRYRQQVHIPRQFTSHVIYSCNAGELVLASDTMNLKYLTEENNVVSL